MQVYIVCDSLGNPMVPFKTMQKAVEYNKRHGGGYKIIMRGGKMVMRQGERMRLCIEQEREEIEKVRSGMPGSIRRNGKWTRERKDGPMAFQAKADWMVRDMVISRDMVK